MEALRQNNVPLAQRGALMIEVLVTILILAIGLMGLMQMQTRLQKSEMESYQRTQAVILLNDMASRLQTNRLEIASYETDGLDPAYLGVGGPADPCESTFANGLQPGDSGEWCRALQGAAEESQAGSSVGAMIGGRGCVEFVDTNQWMVTVVWQGLTPISAPPLAPSPLTGVTCGEGEYNLPAGSACAEAGNEDMCRRYVTTLVRIADLTP